MRRLILNVWLTLCLTASCTKPDKPNVLLISIDTLRADHLSVYGHEKTTTPSIDRLADTGVRFETVVSPVPLTLPAHTTMLTGTTPPRHGVHDNLGYELGDEAFTLAEAFSAQAYDTAAVVSSFVLDARFNLDQGFQSYDDDFAEEHTIGFLNERKGDETASRAIDWLSRHHSAPFFLFVHFYDPHDDYAPPEPFASRFADDPYAGEIAFTDALVGRLLDHLEALGVRENTYVVLTADHGEMLGEHGEQTHGFFVYRSALEVPLIVNGPGLEPAVRSERAGLLDVAPTIAGLVGLELGGSVEGHNLLGNEPLPPRRELYFESVTPNRYYGANSLAGILAGNWKYIHTSRPELYDLARDPDESVNVLTQNPDVGEGMRSRVERLLTTALSDADESGADVDEETRKRLASLGYLSSQRQSSPTSDDGRSDPKDWIGFFTRHQDLEKLVGRGEYEDATELAMALVDEWPGFVAGYFQLARIATETRDLPAARRYYEEALSLAPDNAGAHHNLANILRTLGDAAAAGVHYERARALDPSFENPLAAGSAAADDVDSAQAKARSHHGRGMALQAEGKLPQALIELESAVRLDPGFALAENDLGVVLKQLGRTDDAVEHYRRALSLDPLLAPAHNNMGSALGAKGDLAGAIEHFEKATAAEPDYAEARNNLGLALRMSGRRDEALPHFEKALSVRPGWPGPMSEIAWILATHPDPSVRNPSRALALAEGAARRTQREHPVVLDTLAAAHAANGDFPRAIAASEQAIAIVEPRSPALAAEFRGRLERYRSGAPYVEPAEIRAAPR